MCVEYGLESAANRSVQERVLPLPLSVFRLDALALSVIATATWLAGWLSVTAGIVSK